MTIPTIDYRRPFATTGGPGRLWTWGWPLISIGFALFAAYIAVKVPYWEGHDAPYEHGPHFKLLTIFWPPLTWVITIAGASCAVAVLVVYRRSRVAWVALVLNAVAAALPFFTMHY